MLGIQSSPRIKPITLTSPDPVSTQPATDTDSPSTTLPPSDPTVQSDTPQSGSVPPDLTVRLPTVLFEKTAIYLLPNELARLAETNSSTHLGVREVFRQCLKSEFRTGDPVDAFKAPEKRLDRHVPVDLIGWEYLHNNGVPNNYLHGKIKSGAYSIAQAQQIFKSNTAKMEAQKAKQPTLELVLTKGPKNQHAIELIEAGVLTVDQFVNLNREGGYALRSAGVIRVFESGVMTVAQLNKMTKWAADLMDCTALQEALCRGELSVKQILAVKEPDVRGTDRANLRNYLGTGKLSLDQFSRLSKQDCADLALPGVKRMLDNGSMTMAQILDLSSEQRRAL